MRANQWMRLMVVVIVVCGVTMRAQQPRIVNANLQSRAAGGDLQKEFDALVASASQPAWIAWPAPLVDGRHSMCCSSSDNCCGGCALEGSKGSANINTGQPVKLEGPSTFTVFFRIAERQVEKIRTFSEDCSVDAGGLPVYWLNGVRPADGVAVLSGFARATADGEKDHRADSAVTAIALHGDPAADRALERMVAPGQPESLRGRAAFWLGVARGQRGYQLLRGMLDNDPSERVRDKVVFALSQSREAEALATLIGAAKNDKSAHVRGQAIFWLAQKAGKQAAGTITEAIENDPDTEVKKRAVFALSQLPRDEGVPLLIQVARSNKNPAARKQAMFWLGQSRDPRALAFFEQVLAPPSR